MSIFYSRVGNKGGILFPVLAILFMFTLLLIYVTEDYFSRREMLVNTKDFYLGRTIEEISRLDIDTTKKEEPSVFYFNIGETKWQWDEERKDYLVKTSLSNQYKRTSNQEISAKR